MKSIIKWILSDNSSYAKCARTIIQGVIAVIISVITFYSTTAPEWVSICICPTLMAILSPLMAILGGDSNE